MQNTQGFFVAKRKLAYNQRSKQTYKIIKGVLMDRLSLIQKLITILLKDMPSCNEQASHFGEDYAAQRALLRGLMNMREPKHPLPPEFFKLQDELLQAELAEKAITNVALLKPAKINPQLRLYKGDITCIKADAIVNAANSTLLGCFIAGHNCIDNCIHSAAGLQLRYECKKIMDAQGHEEAAGQAKISNAYNLPCRYVIHTVGPIVNWQVTPADEMLLKSCYTECLKLAVQYKLNSIVFPCISTGVFHFPRINASRIAVETCDSFLKETKAAITVVFNTFLDNDHELYTRLLDPKPEDDKKSDDLRPFFNPNLF